MATRDYYTYGTNLNDREFFTTTVQTPYGIKRYFSNVDSEIYFGDILMEDIYKFDFSVEEKKLPIYGYNCFYADVIVPGQRFVSGSFVLNYTNSAHINDVLSKIDDSIMNKTVLETEVYNPGDKERDKPLWSKNFDIMLGYGYYKSDLPTYNANCQTICGVQISGMQLVLDTTGQPIMEVYSFVAKDFIEGDATGMTPAEQSNDNTNSNKDDDDNTSGKSKAASGSNIICADANDNEDYSDKYLQYRNSKNNPIGVVHNIVYKKDSNDSYYIEVNIRDFDGNVLNITDFKLIIDDQRVASNIQYSGTQDNKGAILISLLDTPKTSKKIKKVLEEESEEEPRVNCTLKYTLKNNKKKYDVLYEGYIYLFNE